MGDALWPLFLLVGSNLIYQTCSKNAAKSANPFAALVITYIIAALASLIMYFFTCRNDGPFMENVKSLNLWNYLMGVAIIGLEGGFLYLYKHGWNISVGPVCSYTGVAIGLLAIGAIFYHEPIGLRQIIGTLLCLGGIALVSL